MLRLSHHGGRRATRLDAVLEAIAAGAFALVPRASHVGITREGLHEQLRQLGE